MDKDWKEFIKKAKEEYYKIDRVNCPAFNNEGVFFTSSGFNHLQRKNRKLRDKNIQIRRISLCYYAPGILKRATQFLTHYTDVDARRTRVDFWSLEGKVNGINLVVIVRQIDNHSKHFFSVFEK